MKIRAHTFTGKLSASTHDNLNALLHQLQQLWNAALQERIDAYRKFGISITWVDQFKSLTEIRQDEEFSQYPADAQRSILKRLELAFLRFFDRVKKGEKPGFPRFKPKHRVCSFEMRCPRIHRKGKWNWFFVKGIVSPLIENASLLMIGNASLPTRCATLSDSVTHPIFRVPERRGACPPSLRNSEAKL